MKRGFTLTELLVVSAIILILVAIILPVYNRAKDSANTAAMLAQQHQITTALRLYSEDYDGKHITHRGLPGQDWPNKLYTYTKSREILRNPRYTGKTGGIPPLGYGFGLNGCLFFTEVVETENPIWLIESAPFELPSGTAVQMLTSNHLDIYSPRLYPGAEPFGGKWLADSRNGGSVVSFWDGSVKWVPSSSIPYRYTSCHLKSGEKGYFETMKSVN